MISELTHSPNRHLLQLNNQNTHQQGQLIRDYLTLIGYFSQATNIVENTAWT